MNIGIDIDNTITTGNRFNELLPSLVEGFIIEKHYDEYPIEKSLKKHGFIKEENEFDYMKLLRENEHFLYSNENIFDGVSEAVTELKRLGYGIYFITARSPGLEKYTRDLLERNNIPYDKLFHLGSYDKNKVSNEYDIKIFIEDNTSNIENLLKDSCVEKAILMTSSYNKTKLLGNNDVIRVDDWKSMVDVVTRLERIIASQ